TVVSSPAGINCTTGSCEASFAHGTLVKLKGTPNAGSTAVSWGASGCPGTVNGSNECEVTMTADKERSEERRVEQHKLKVTPAGSGGGTVVSSPAGINCTTGSCEASFAHGTLVKLKGTPNAGSTAVSWGASGCPGTVNGSNECEVTMTADKE